MARDIFFQDDGFVFSFRAGGLLIQDGRVLLQKHREKEDYYIIGGHIVSLETARDALKREFKEELGAEIRVDCLVSVAEAFYPWEGTPWHQICFYYKIHLEDGAGMPLDGVIHGQDELGGQRFDLDFCWVPLSRLERGLRLYPPELIPIILEEPEGIVHFVYDEFRRPRPEPEAAVPPCDPPAELV